MVQVSYLVRELLFRFLVARLRVAKQVSNLVVWLGVVRQVDEWWCVQRMAPHRYGDGVVVAARVVLGEEVTGEHLHEVQVHVRLRA